ncbi:like-conjugating enzyme ATG10 [Seminavis robusta]|uniref:Ubiquitin-like-conjugating enzyme ATG10 n=1 Tax=Seminavis robusta TaxID=568900 RepID=A0A9N8DKN0_9STRA|nr:like-conjugating enzyme ATG10 [Seminavis robusta]|eukprot:Sro137_g064460.1 like-conjugating enzyme ATG10 (281) ;mRNA; r:77263-78105
MPQLVGWSREEFNEEAQRLVSALKGLQKSSSASQEFLSDWLLEADGNAGHGGGFFLKHPSVTRIVRVDHQETTETEEEHHHEEEEDAFCDDTILQDDSEVMADPIAVDTSNDGNKSIHHSDHSSSSFVCETRWHFSIVYSNTWKAPIFYFTVENMNDNSSPCPRSDVLQILMTFSHYNRVEDAWEFLSHEEHPISRIPSFFLHPCQTLERLQTLLKMQSTMNGTENGADCSNCRLLSWLSMILPSVGYSFPSKLFQELQEQLSLPSLEGATTSGSEVDPS